MHRDRVMDIGPDSMLLQIGLEPVPLFTSKYKQMPYWSSVLYHRELEFRIMELCQIPRRDPPTRLVPLIQILQLDLEQCRLELIQPGIHSHIVMDIFFLRPIVPDCSNSGG